MSSGKKLLLAVILLPFAVYAGIKLYIRHNVKSALDDMVRAAMPFASIRYGSVGSSLAGQIRIEDVKITPNGFADEIRIRDIEVQTPGLKFLLTGTRQSRAGEYPRKLQLALHGVALDLGGQMMEMVDRFASAAASDSPGTMHCGDIRFFGPRQYRKLGYDSLVTDAVIGYELEAAREGLSVHMEWRMHDMGRLTIDMVLPGNPATWGTQKRVSEFRAVYEDLSFTDRMKRYCAQTSGISIDDYINAELGQNDAAWLAHWGFVPGPGLREAYRQFLQKPGEVRITARPADGLDPATLKMYKPEDALAMLNLTLSVNGAPVTDLSYQREVTDGSTLAAHDAAPEPADSPTVPTPAPVASRVRADEEASGYRVVKVAELAQHIGRQVRVHAGRTTMREGILAEVQPQELLIERRYAGGAMTVKVPLKQIEKVEVLF